MKSKIFLVPILLVLLLSLSGCCTVDDAPLPEKRLPDYPYLSLYVPEFPQNERLLEDDSPLTFIKGPTPETALVAMSLAYWLEIYQYTVTVENAYQKFLAWKNIQDRVFMENGWKAQEVPPAE